jgi:hypothetical protein
MGCPLHSILNVVPTYINLHNIFILLKNIFYMTWIEDVEKELQSPLAQGELREGYE